MRIFQIALLGLAVAALVVALFSFDTSTGETFWEAGVAVLLFDIVCIMLWPRMEAAKHS